MCSDTAERNERFADDGCIERVLTHLTEDGVEETLIHGVLTKEDPEHIRDNHKAKTRPRTIVK